MPGTGGVLAGSPTGPRRTEVCSALSGTSTPDRGVRAAAVQTFLPYPDFQATAEALDDRRLGKQRVETLQVLRALSREQYGWKNHPAVRMWAGHEEALAAYGLAICAEWSRRGHADTCAVKIRTEVEDAGIADVVRAQAELGRAGALPWWLGDERLHRSHRLSLLRKEPDHYRRLFGEDDDDDSGYVWPSRLDRRDA